jgi:uncharacterized protein YjbI with pentapeptide repeats
MSQDQRPRRWWKDNWPLLVSVALAVVIATIAGLGYWLRWTWTGLDTKSAWDWLELLIIPIALGAGAFWFNRQERRAQNDLETRRQKSEQALAEDRAREEALQHYLDRMQELILDKGLRRSQKDEEIKKEIRDVARTRTLAVLRSLDGNRKGQVVRFLHEADLIGNLLVVEEPEERPQVIEAIIDLQTADLNGAHLSRAVLYHADLSGANLSGADLSGVNLRDADLSSTDLSGASLIRANLRDANLRDANLRNANLIGASLIRANLRDANLRNANLIGASLIRANLRDANLIHANLIGANLSRADLRGAEGWSDRQLAQAESLIGVTLSDGKEITEVDWEEFKKQYRVGG